MFGIEELDFKFNLNDLHCFECKKYCGRCCWATIRPVNSILLFYQEVRRIQEYLEKFFLTEKLEEFVSNLCMFKNRVDLIGDKTILEGEKNSLWDFFTLLPVMRGEEGKERGFVRAYILRSFGDSRRCVFFDPIEKVCIIHDVKPLVCKLYPFDVRYDFRDNKKLVEIGVFREGCLGLDSKIPIDLDEVKKLAFELIKTDYEHNRKFCELIEPIDSEFIEKQKSMPLSNISLEKDENEKVQNAMKEYSMGAKSRGLIISTKNIRDLFLENDLIKENKELMDRLRKGLPQNSLGKLTFFS